MQGWRFSDQLGCYCVGSLEVCSLGGFCFALCMRLSVSFLNLWLCYQSFRHLVPGSVLLPHPCSQQCTKAMRTSILEHSLLLSTCGLIVWFALAHAPLEAGLLGA